MTRVKTFDNTGIATSGRLYAGDLNLIQDQFADLVNLLQTHAVGTLQIGESGLQLLRYGAGEARLSGMLRTDGILRALGGLYAGAFTTAQRDAIAAGSRPYGLVILNTQNNRLEWNSGTDAVPAWQPVSDPTGDVLIGSTIEWPWTHTQLPSNYLLPYGQAVSRATYPILNAIASASGYPHGNGDGSTTFTLPDYRGRVSVGRDDMGTVAANRITAGGGGINGNTLGAVGGVQNIALAAGEIPVHSHGLVAATVTGIPAITGSVSNGSLALSGAISHGISLTGTPALTGAPTMSGSPAIGGAPDAGSLYGYTPGNSVSWTPEAGNIPMNAFYGGGDGTQSQQYVGIGGGPGIGSLYVTAGSLAVAKGSLAVNAGSLGITGSVSNGTLGISGTVSNGTLAATAGTLDVGGTTDNAGSGAVHNNIQPSIIVNRAIRVA